MLSTSMDVKLHKMRDKSRLQTFDVNGRIYIPKDIREQFKDCLFWIEVEGGKIVLKPVRIQ